MNYHPGRERQAKKVVQEECDVENGQLWSPTRVRHLSNPLLESCPNLVHWHLSDIWPSRGLSFSGPRVARCNDGHNDSWHLQREDVILDSPLHVLGEGAFGMVCAGTLYGLPVAVKIPTCADNPNKRSTVDAITRELYILQKAQHPNVVLSHGAFLEHDEGTWRLVLERIDGLRMRELFQSFPEALKDRKGCHSILTGIAQALQHLHNLQPCIVHGDLKPANIMVEGWSSNPRAKLIDFGLSHVSGLPSIQIG